tara:strand:+ start:156 stop:602 length:447 start_codon:yes stop_codon:yes gene_type:complete
MAYASGKKAFGISDRSGFRFRLRDMKREWTGALVGPDEFEPKHPQLEPIRVGPDPQALQNPRPDKAEALQVYVGVPTVEAPTLERVRAIASVGEVSLTGVADSISVTPTGVNATGSVGSVTVSTTVSAPRFDSTSITLDTTTDTFDEG